MMHIGFDAKRLFLNQTGLGNYSRSLVSALVQTFPEHQYYLYTPRVKETPETAFIKETGHLHIRQPALPLLTALWRSRLVLPRLKKDGLDIYHGLSHEIPVGIAEARIKTVVTIHDLIFFRYPGYYPLADRKIYAAKFRYACRQADKIIAVSEQTKRDLQQFLQVPAEKTEVIYQSCNPAFRHAAQQPVPENLVRKYHLPDRFLLNVGTIETRKNLMLVARALRHLPGEITCVVVGKKTAYYETVSKFLAANRMEHRMLFREGIPAADLPFIYRMARAFLYPSRFEGFGIPVLEALSAGVPVIAAKGSCLEEAGGESSIYVDPDDEQAMAAAIARLWNNDTVCMEMITQGYLHARRFEPTAIARQVMNLYQRMTGKEEYR